MSKRPMIPRRSLLAAGGAATFEMTRLGAAVLLGSCGEPSTGGERVTITTRARSDIADNPVIDSSLGWHIEVTRGELALDYLYYVSGPPAGLAQQRHASFSIPSAHAHPGHYDSGDVLGELQGPVTLDLLSREAALGSGRGVTGQPRSAVVTLGRLRGDDAALAVVLEGVASREDTAIPFRAALERAAVEDPTSHLPEIDGCPFDGDAIESDGTVLLEISVAVWLDRIDFAAVSVPKTGLALLDPDTPPHNAFRRGVAKAIGYEFRFFSEGTR
jgi:hypothetical protein